MTFVAVWLLTIPYLQAIGGLFLLPIAVKLLLPGEHTEEINAADSLMGAVKTIIVADFIMSIDNVLAIAGAAAGHFLLVVIGLVISIPIVVGGSQLIGRVMVESTTMAAKVAPPPTPAMPREPSAVTMTSLTRKERLKGSMPTVGAIMFYCVRTIR